MAVGEKESKRKKKKIGEFKNAIKASKLACSQPQTWLLSSEAVKGKRTLEETCSPVPIKKKLTCCLEEAQLFLALNPEKNLSFESSWKGTLWHSEQFPQEIVAATTSK